MADVDTLDSGEFKVEYDGPDADNAGNINATDGQRNVIVQAAADQKSWVRHRVAKGFHGAECRVFIVELEGVRLYVNGDTYILTTQDNYHSARK